MTPRFHRTAATILGVLLWTALSYLILPTMNGALAQTRPGAGTNLFAPDVELVFEHITVDDGLPENSVRAILQDSSGFLWFGTMNGLVRYDGYELKVTGTDYRKCLTSSQLP